MVNGIAWCCPHCRRSLGPGRRCLGCGSAFRALRGIPDLRTADDVYLPNADDWALALRLDAAYDRLDFRGLLDLYFDLSAEVTPDQRRRQVAHILTAPARARRWLDAISPRGPGAVLDLGCGSGSFLAAVGREVPDLIGVDIAMRWLLVARKRLDGEGLGHVPLACACAESLPLPDAAVAAVVAGDVIEHVDDQPATLAEAHRVLRPGGRLFMASPNRFSLAPEPHVHVWGVGYLPRRWMPAYVWWRRKIGFLAVNTLGFREWVRTLRLSPFRGGRIEAPPLSSDDLAQFGRLKRAAARLYNAAVTTWVGQRLARAVGPLFHVVCEKPSADGPRRSPSPAIHRRSRRSAARG